MTSSVQSLTLIYDAPNERGTFSGGDALRGTVSLTVAKDITVQTLFVKFKGDANVQWSQKSGEHTHSYSAHRRYFKLKQVLIPESSKGESWLRCDTFPVVVSSLVETICVLAAFLMHVA